MSIGEISPCSTSTRSFSRSFDSPRSSTPSRQEFLNNAGALSSARSDGTPKTRTIAIALKAHKRMRKEPFAYTFHHLVERKNCKVVVICCLSRLQSEMGVDYVIDVETFGGISKTKLEAAINNQMNALNHFLQSFREKLEQRGVELDIRISAGPKSNDILVKAARALQPHWVVLDSSFSWGQKEIQKNLECNLVLVRTSSKPMVLNLTNKYLGPIEQICDQPLEDYPEPHLDCPSPRLSPIGTPGHVIIQTNLTVTNETNTAVNNTNSKVYMFCMCCSKPLEEEGPTKETTVIYGNTTPGSGVQYLGKVGNESMNEVAAVLSTRISSPAASPTARYGSTTTRRSTTKAVKILEQGLEARMAKHREEDDKQEYRVQL